MKVNKQKNTVSRGALPSSKYYFMDITDEDAKIMSKIKSLMNDLTNDALEKLVAAGQEVLASKEEKHPIIESFGYVAVSMTRDIEPFTWNVLLERKVDKRKFWMDVSIDTKYHDILSDWNQYIFISTSEDDMERKNIQENCDEYEDASSAAIAYLEDIKEILQDDSGNWYPGVEESDWDKIKE